MTETKSIFFVIWLSFAGLSLGQTNDRSPAASLGQLQIQGTHITKLVLQRTEDNHRETLTDPNGTLLLPVGTYRITEITLKDQYVYDSSSQSPLEKIVITEDTPQALKIGGPLTPSIEITRRGRQMNLAYKLEGMGHETYRSLVVDPSKAPTFTVYQGKTSIDTGTFEYG